MFRRKYNKTYNKTGDIKNKNTVVESKKVLSRSGYNFAISSVEVEKFNMDELKKMIDFIIDNGYKIKTLDFRESFFSGSIGGKSFSNRIESLKDDLLDITIYRNDDIQKTYTYIKGKCESLKELLSIQDGSIFGKEQNEIFDYIKNK